MAERSSTATPPAGPQVARAFVARAFGAPMHLGKLFARGTNSLPRAPAACKGHPGAGRDGAPPDVRLAPGRAAAAAPPLGAPTPAGGQAAPDGRGRRARV